MLEQEFLVKVASVQINGDVTVKDTYIDVLIKKKKTKKGNRYKLKYTSRGGLVVKASASQLKASASQLGGRRFESELMRPVG